MLERLIIYFPLVYTVSDTIVFIMAANSPHDFDDSLFFDDHDHIKKQPPGFEFNCEDFSPRNESSENIFTKTNISRKIKKDPIEKYVLSQKKILQNDVPPGICREGKFLGASPQGVPRSRILRPVLSYNKVSENYKWNNTFNNKPQLPDEKKKLIFDLDGTFLYKVSRYSAKKPNSVNTIDPVYPINFRARNYIIYMRPGAEELLAYLLFEYKNVAIWTSMQKQNAEPIIQKLFTLPLIKNKLFKLKLGGENVLELFKFIWYRTDCVPDPDGDTYDVLKPTSKLNNSNFIIFEDNPKKIKGNSSEFIRIIPTFDATKNTDDNNEYLFELLDDIRSGNF